MQKKPNRTLGRKTTVTEMKNSLEFNSRFEQTADSVNLKVGQLKLSLRSKEKRNEEK